MTRPSWDEYFLNIARQVATRATCDRKHVGAVIVREKTILSTGYNGSIRGLEHCDEAGHLMEEGHCVRTVHAESNAIAQAAKNGVAVDRAAIYVTASPCWGCFRLLANSGITRMAFGEFYRDERIFEVAEKLGIELVDLSASLRSQDDILLAAEEALAWCGGSADFAEGGQAHEGWKKIALPAIAALRAAQQRSFKTPSMATRTLQCVVEGLGYVVEVRADQTVAHARDHALLLHRTAGHNVGFFPHAWEVRAEDGGSNIDARAPISSIGANERLFLRRGVGA